MYDDWIVRRTPLDFENLCDGIFFESICSQAINRFRRQRDDFTGAKQFRRVTDGLLKKRRRVRLQDFGRLQAQTD